MKTSKVITLTMVALALCASPALAQRGGSRGGGGSHSGGGHSSSMSSSRGSSSSMGSSRSSSSSSRSSSSFSSSRSSSSTRSSASNVGSSRSASRSTATYGSHNGGRSVGSSVGERGAGSSSRNDGVRGSSSFRNARQAGVTSGHSGARGGSVAARTGHHSGARSGAPSASPRTSPGMGHDRGYARPGRPGGYVPPAVRPIHPAPYFHHPWHGYVVHCHPIFWDPIPPRPWYWPGFWHYCHSYWYDYHVTDVVVVHDYVQKTYNVDMITYGISGDIMYAIVRDGGSTYLQVYDNNDRLLAEQKINKRYCNMVIDAENGGCWISKKNNKDPLLFIWADGQLLIYEED